MHLGLAVFVIGWLHSLGETNDGTLNRALRSSAIGALSNFPAKVDLTEVKCSRFGSDLDLIRQFPFPITVYSEEDEDDYTEPKAMLYRNSTSVKEIHLSKSVVVPSSIYCLSKLEKLAIHATPFLNGIIPDAFGNLQNLQFLYIYDTRIVKITTEFESLVKIKSLRLRKCSLTSAPNLRRLEELQILDLSNNQLSQLSDLPALRFLSVAQNRFTQIPMLRSRDQMEYLALDNNVLRSAAGITSYPNLIGLYMKNTTITSIPSTIDQLRHLEDVFLSDNHISDIPPSIHNLPNLQSLDIKNNPLSSEKVQSIKKAFAKSHPNLELMV